jgi:hypothetical protein
MIKDDWFLVLGSGLCFLYIKIIDIICVYVYRRVLIVLFSAMSQ